ncbi:hypothetical protein FOXG_15897 [Fusarium oxysporum f. sp. lycopersici 4287]|uniref:Uncharacterized protein n=2 Tax=Fusarium oxysporum TaxID=5507 RepID=A0A0J9W759_FUSO4|nr:hypothetical protein FOXG_15897 [Fusarium oxysporum f. sp. lycopersici 4287]EXK26744.1 hypothetical protein FOMG_16690 [Fusarium oxysporum f. sp. melonis 26406]KNB18481.1 hypothetical protein FOXG_15897 [Fusarium oxysporum f. sp. lycopersici 4287]
MNVFNLGPLCCPIGLLVCDDVDGEVGDNVEGGVVGKFVFHLVPTIAPTTMATTTNRLTRPKTMSLLRFFDDPCGNPCGKDVSGGAISRSCPGTTSGAWPGTTSFSLL